MRTLFFIVVVILIFIKPAESAGFDCEKAYFNNEIQICKDAWLSRLDENYSSLYKIVRGKIRHNKNENKRVVSEASAALKERDLECANRECLIEWYNSGIARLTHQLKASSPETLRSKLTSQRLYEKLNLRTFHSVFGPRIKADCATYLKDYFPKSVVRFEPGRLVIIDDDYYWRISIVDENTIEISNSVSAASYNSTNTENVYYDPGAKEFRVEAYHHDKLINIPQNSLCRHIQHGMEPEYGISKSAFADSHTSRDLERMSLGEFQLKDYLPGHTVGVFDAPGGRKIGQMNISVVDGERDNLRANAWLYDNDFTTLIEPVLVHRDYYPALLVFAVTMSWFNVSPDPKVPVWLKRNSIPDLLEHDFNSREQVILGGEHITLDTARNLRAAPAVKAELLGVIKPFDRALLLPVSINGNWMKVARIAPWPNWSDFGLGLEALRGNKKYKIIEGWTLWRGSPAQQYIDVHYPMHGA